MYVDRSKNTLKGMQEEDLSPALAFLTNLASDGLLKSRTGAPPQLVFDDRDFRTTAECKIGKIQLMRNLFVQLNQS